MKRVPENEHLLVDNSIYVDGEQIKQNRIYNQLYQEPNAKLLGIPLQLHIYNLGRPNPDSTFQNWLYRKPGRKEWLTKLLSEKQVKELGKSYVNFHEWLKSAGEPPTITSESRTERSADRLQAWYWNEGWFNTEVDYEIDYGDNQRATVDYFVTPKQPYTLDTVSTLIASKAADSVYQMHQEESFLKPGEQYSTQDFNAERERLTAVFRNNGLFYFEEEYLTFEADTIDTDLKVRPTVVIQNRLASIDGSSRRVPYKVHNISQVNIFPDFTYENRNEPVTDTSFYNGYHIFGFDRIKYSQKALTDAVFITPGETYSDEDLSLTYSRLNQLRTFRYPDIQYMEDPADTTNTDLIANIFLTPRQKFSLGFEFDVSQSNIQDFGIGFGGSLMIRNVFRGAEILEISGRGSIGSSAEAADTEDRFFNISEIGSDIKLTFPRLLFPVPTERVIPKHMHPFTSLSVGTSNQNNIGLDRQNLTAIMNYRWAPSESLTHQLDLLNLQYVRNLNVENYFNVYRNSFEELNNIATAPNITASDEYFNIGDNGTRILTIPEGATGFLREARQGNSLNLNSVQRQNLNDIRERRNRLTENNLILATNFSYILNEKEDIYDEDFHRFRIKLESAGNLLAGISKIANVNKDEEGRYELLGVNFSQYIKTEIDYIKHWDLGSGNIFAIRTFGGVAIPYGNANSIPFTRSFFAGGPNDNRAWQAYSLGPGSSGGRNEFNEANLKLALSAEYRYHLFGDLNSAFFIDAGNIWNFMDVVEEEASTFTSLSDLGETAIGTGIGLRYDFNFFVLRFDVGFKTYNPARNQGERWFKDFNLRHAVFNVGINYPF